VYRVDTVRNLAIKPYTLEWGSDFSVWRIYLTTMWKIAQ
jgi:hypothetical protein